MPLRRPQDKYLRQSTKSLKQLYNRAQSELVDAQDNWRQWLIANPDLARFYGFADEHDGIETEQRRRELTNVKEWQTRQALWRFILEIGREIDRRFEAQRELGRLNVLNRETPYRDPGLEQRVLAVKRKNPNKSGAKIAEILQLTGDDVDKVTVNRILKKFRNT